MELATDHHNYPKEAFTMRSYGNTQQSTETKLNPTINSTIRKGHTPQTLPRSTRRPQPTTTPKTQQPPKPQTQQAPAPQPNREGLPERPHKHPTPPKPATGLPSRPKRKSLPPKPTRNYAHRILNNYRVKFAPTQLTLRNGVTETLNPLPIS